jgi:hypothetical protein
MYSVTSDKKSQHYHPSIVYVALYEFFKDDICKRRHQQGKIFLHLY